MINFWGYSNSPLQVYVHVFDEHGNTVLKTIAGFHVQMFVQMLNPRAPKTATPRSSVRPSLHCFYFIRFIFVVGMHFLGPKQQHVVTCRKRKSNARLGRRLLWFVGGCCNLIIFLSSLRGSTSCGGNNIDPSQVRRGLPFHFCRRQATSNRIPICCRSLCHR